MLYTYATIGGRDSAVDTGTVYVKLVRKDDRSHTQQEVVSDLRSKLVHLGGVTTSISTGFDEGQKQIQLQLQGRDAGELTRIAESIAAEARKVPSERRRTNKPTPAPDVRFRWRNTSPSTTAAIGGG